MDNVHFSSEEIKNVANSLPPAVSERFVNGSSSLYIEGDDMELCDGGVEDGLISNGSCSNAASAAICMNGNSHPSHPEDNEMEEMGR